MKRTSIVTVAGAVALLGAPAWAQLETSGTPALAVKFTNPSNGASFERVYSTAFRPGIGWVVSDAYIQGDMTSPAPDHFVLNVRNVYADTNYQITDVRFPYDASPVSLNLDAADDVFLMPWVFGVAFMASTAPVPCCGQWYHNGGYPGPYVSPLVVHTDKTTARVYAAANWPPRYVEPSVLPNRMMINYPNLQLANGQASSFRAISKTVRGNESAGNPPWMPAVDPYKAWLRPQMQSVGLWPVAYPQWMREAHGFLGLGLQDINENNLPFIRNLFNFYSPKLPWAQMWGQMSCLFNGNYNDPCYSCCALDRTLHPRWTTAPHDIRVFARDLAESGFHAGYYAAPYYGSRWDLIVPDGSGQTNRDWFRGWIDNHDAWNASAYYLDTYGWVNFGDVMESAEILRDDPRLRNAIIEGAVDIYPAGNMVSLSLHFPGAGFPGGPGNSYWDLGNGTTSITFPQLGTYLIDDHIIFNGTANTGWMLWGPANQHWTERQVFLLGHRYETFQPCDDWSQPFVIDLAMGLAIDLRIQHGWAARAPRYRDRQGLSNIPNGIDARRYTDANGEDLVCVDNWSQLAHQTLSFNGQMVDVSSERLSILAKPVVISRPGVYTTCPDAIPWPALEIQASGAGPLSYQWRKDGLPVDDGPTVGGSTLYGTHTPILRIGGVRAWDEGSYDCVVANAFGFEASNAVRLVVCIADTDDGSGNGLCDGGVTIEDLLFYLGVFEIGDLRADVDDGSATGTPDGGVTIDDLLYYLLRFEAGC